MDTTQNPPLHTTNQVINSSFKLYRAVIFRVFFLSLLLSIVVFIPRLLSTLFGKDVLGELSYVGWNNLWLILIDFAALTLLTAILWRINCFMRNSHESLLDDFKNALKRVVPILIAVIVQVLLVILTLIACLTLARMIFTPQEAMTLNFTFSTELLIGVVSCTQAILVIYFFFAFCFYLPIILVENKGFLAAMTKSVRLVWGNWWRTVTVLMTPLLAYLVSIILVKYLFKINIHLYYTTLPEPQSLTATVVHIILFAAFIPWVAAAMLVQLQDLEKRANLK